MSIVLICVINLFKKMPGPLGTGFFVTRLKYLQISKCPKKCCVLFFTVHAVLYWNRIFFKFQKCLYSLAASLEACCQQRSRELPRGDQLTMLPPRGHLDQLSRGLRLLWDQMRNVRSLMGFRQASYFFRCFNLEHKILYFHSIFQYPPTTKNNIMLWKQKAEGLSTTKLFN